MAAVPPSVASGLGPGVNDSPTRSTPPCALFWGEPFLGEMRPSRYPTQAHRKDKEGLTAKESAAILRISARTKESHKDRLMKELGLRTTAELTRFAIKHGVVAD